jgi:hypothetical protein
MQPERRQLREQGCRTEQSVRRFLCMLLLLKCEKFRASDARSKDFTMQGKNTSYRHHKQRANHADKLRDA